MPIEVILVLGGLILFMVLLIVGIIYWSRARTRKAEAEAQAALAAVLEPGEQLLNFLKVNTKGPSTAAVLVGGWIAASAARRGGSELYLGLTPRRLILTPAKPDESARQLQSIPREEITGFDVSGGMYGSGTFTAHTRTGEVVLFLADNNVVWQRRAMAMKKGFASLPTAAPEARASFEPSMQQRTPKENVTLAPVLDAAAARQKRAGGGRTTLIIGAVAMVLGCGLTYASNFEVLYWGAILFGGIAVISGLVQLAKAGKAPVEKKPEDQMPWK